MEPGDWIDNDKSGLRIFCHNAKSKYIIHVWKTVIVSRILYFSFLISK